jgi:hypothetical protein
MVFFKQLAWVDTINVNVKLTQDAPHFILISLIPVLFQGINLSVIINITPGPK